MKKEWINDIVNAINSTDWISNSIQILLGLLTIVVPIIYATWVSKRETKELDKRQERLEKAIGLLSEYQIKIGLYEKRLQLYHFFKDLGDKWDFLYKRSSSKNSSTDVALFVTLNYFCQELLEKNPKIMEYSDEDIDSLVFTLTENHNNLITNFENLEIYFSFSDDHRNLVKEIKNNFIEIYRKLLECFNTLKNEKRLNSCPGIEVRTLYEIFQREEYFSILDFFKNELVPSINI